MATKRNNAERYLYLRNRLPADVLGQVKSAAGCWIDCEDENGTLVLLTGDDADFAVDAAMDNDDERMKMDQEPTFTTAMIEAIYAAWHGAGVDIAGGDWARFVGMLPRV